ncbi:extracellular solute-binding protein [Falsiroseomonas tokyonensis]|uniref:Extracellular solute-binding protein n=1 Tax=Falsiroseomonas tokyonensis TaxID=430521 RepID=A0ABV7BY43_9PROT|nr:extracellular solute-binding protein [Falsiroseomonas tokyonensis]MBU8539335.1 extracellular solute-binding protein [Falsiroseomonas tokyonensis]
MSRDGFLSRPLTRRTALTAATLPLLAPSARAQQRFTGREIVATAFGGPSQDLIQRLVYDPIARETGARGTQTPLLSANAFARMRAETQAPQIDLFMYSGGQQVAAKAGDLTQKLPDAPNFANVPANLKDADGQWIAWGLVTEGILYRPDKIATPPRSYRDFFKPEFEGHIAFPHITNGYGTDFLVMLAKTFGGSEQNIGPGFEALKRISGRANIFRSAAEVQTLFASGDIWIMPYDGASAMRSKAMGIPVSYAVPEEGAPYVLLTGAVAKRSRNADIASFVLNRHLDPEVQTAIAREIGWAPVNTATQLPPDVAPFMAPTDKLANLDRDAINANRPAWTDRFNREIAR